LLTQHIKSPINKLFGVLLVSNTIAVSAIAQEIPARNGATALIKDGAGSVPAKVVDTEEVAKKLANPIANMISVPLQYEFSRGLGRNQGGSEQTLLFQPVAPFNLGGGDTFIVRPIVAGVREVSIQGATGP